ncbi:MAG: DPP IV N-terminal domain-containing protein, partial [Phycisphaerales bacterium]
MIRAVAASLAFAASMVVSVAAADTTLGTTPDPTLDSTRSAIDAARARISSQTAQYHDPVGPRTWIDGSRCWFAETARDGARQWGLCDAAQDGAHARRPLFDHAAVAQLLGTPDAARRLPVRGVSVTGERVALALEGRDEPVVCALGGGVVAERDPAAGVWLETSLSPGKRRSRGQGAAVHLEFVNRLGEPVELFWVDRASNERSYGRIDAGASRRQHTFGGHAWFVRTASGRDLGHVGASDVDRTVAVGDPPPAGPEAVDTLDGQKESDRDGARETQAEPALPVYEVARDGANLVFRADGVEFFRTADGAAGDAYDAHWISPARDAVLALKVRRAPPRPVHIVETAPKDQLQPKLRTLNYTKPGDEIDRPSPRLFRVERAGDAMTAREITLDPALFATPWSIDRVRFLPGGREAAFLYNQRGHQVVRLVGVDLATGATRAIAEESFPTFVDYTNKIWMHWLDETGELLWMTERYGSNNLVLVDVATGLVKRKVTAGTSVVRRVEHVDPRARTVDVAIMGHDPAQDPYHVHFARVSIDTGDRVMLTSGEAAATSFSQDG